MEKPTKFEGGPEELKPVGEAKDAHEAFGLWWARAILDIHTDNGEDRIEGAEDVQRLLATQALLNLEFIKPKIGGFAKALEYISREQSLSFIQSDYGPDEHLAEAAELADMSWDRLSTFPIKASTGINFERGGAVMAMLTGEAQQVWPPEE